VNDSAARTDAINSTRNNSSMSDSQTGAAADSTAAPVPAPPAGKPPAHVQVTWAGAHRFNGQRQGNFPPVRIDASGKTGPSPVDFLLLGMASCTGVDVVDILEKRRTPVTSLEVKASGERFAGTPARITRVLLTYVIDGAGIERPHAERAIDLAVNKYCSVRASLREDIPVEWTLVLNGDPGSTIDPK
jgi:putative redox protein